MFCNGYDRNIIELEEIKDGLTVEIEKRLLNSYLKLLNKFNLEILGSKDLNKIIVKIHSKQI